MIMIIITQQLIMIIMTIIMIKLIMMIIIIMIIMMIMIIIVRLGEALGFLASLSKDRAAPPATRGGGRRVDQLRVCLPSPLSSSPLSFPLPLFLSLSRTLPLSLRASPSLALGPCPCPRSRKGGGVLATVFWNFNLEEVGQTGVLDFQSAFRVRDWPRSWDLRLSFWSSANWPYHQFSNFSIGGAPHPKS